MTLKPENGLVIRYDFLWKEEHQAGQIDGRKDRPCAIILSKRSEDDGSHTVVVCPITHSPPGKNETGIAIPSKLAKHLGLDSHQSWVKTHQANTIRWEKNRIPYGVSKARANAWSYGYLHKEVSEKIFKQFKENSLRGRMKSVQRSEEKETRKPHKIIRRKERDNDRGNGR